MVRAAALDDFHHEKAKARLRPFLLPTRWHQELGGKGTKDFSSPTAAFTYPTGTEIRIHTYTYVYPRVCACPEEIQSTQLSVCVRRQIPLQFPVVLAHTPSVDGSNCVYASIQGGRISEGVDMLRRSTMRKEGGLYGPRTSFNLSVLVPSRAREKTSSFLPFQCLSPVRCVHFFIARREREGWQC